MRLQLLRELIRLCQPTLTPGGQPYSPILPEPVRMQNPFDLARPSVRPGPLPAGAERNPFDPTLMPRERPYSPTLPHSVTMPKPLDVARPSVRPAPLPAGAERNPFDP
jgi:hypothetical protein